MDTEEMNNNPGDDRMTENMAGEERENNSQPALENSILLILGTNQKKISLLLLEKVFFVLRLKELTGYAEYEFIPHVMGEFSEELEEAVKNPEYLEGMWKYTPPKADDHYSGGHILLTKSGKEAYKENIHNMGSDEDFKGYLRNVRTVRRAYNEYADAEMLLLSYNAFPEYAEMSDLYDEIYSDREAIAGKLLKKGRINRERCRELAVDDWHK